jgi:hypothetical protein
VDIGHAEKTHIFSEGTLRFPGIAVSRQRPDKLDFQHSVTPSGINGASFDNPSIPNVTFTYNGPVVHGPVDFTGFAIQSSFGTTTNGKYSSQATSDAGANIGQTDQAVGPLVVAAVPEASSLLLFGLGIVSFGLLGFARKLRA